MNYYRLRAGIAIAASLPLIFLAFGAVAQTSASASVVPAPYPCTTVKIISPYPPGGTTDVLARLIQQGLAKELGAPVIVENKAGASSNIGTEYVSTATPDGCTLLLGNNTGIAINRNLYKLRVDPIKGLAPIGQVASVPLVLYVTASVPAVTVDQLVTLAKKNPGKLSYASGGSGSPQHLMGELFKLEKNIFLVHIPYRGQGPAMQDVLAGQVQMAFETTTVILPHLTSGRVVALATTGAIRSKNLPNIPTMRELGMPNFVTENWYGLFTAAKTPPALILRLSSALNTVLDSKDVRSSLEKMGSSDSKSSPESFTKFIAKELPIWESVVKRSGAKVD